MAYVRNPVVYVPDLTNGRPIVDGKVYLLTSGTIPPMHDSTIDPLDLLTVTFVNEAGNTVEQPQPLYTSKGGCLYGNFPDAARQFMIAPQAYVFAAYNRIGELQYSAETSASDYVETDALAAANSTVLVGGVEAGLTPVPINSIKSLSTAPQIDGRQYLAKGFYADTSVGGGIFKWNAAKSKTTHNGGTVIDPDRAAAWNGTQANLSVLYTAAVSGVGVFDRVSVDTLNAYAFGAVADSSTDNTITINKAISTFAPNNGAILEIPSGAKFNLKSLTLPKRSTLIYYEQDDTSITAGTKKATSELITFQANANNNGIVNEVKTVAPFHPAHVVEVRKDVTSHEAFLGPGQSQTNPVRASYNFLDEGKDAYRTILEHYNDYSVFSGVRTHIWLNRISITGVGTSSFTVAPVKGNLIIGLTSGAEAHVISTTTTTLELEWFTGTFQVGELLVCNRGTIAAPVNETSSTTVATAVETLRTGAPLAAGYDTGYWGVGMPPTAAKEMLTVGGKVGVQRTRNGGWYLPTTVTDPSIVWADNFEAVTINGYELTYDTVPAAASRRMNLRKYGTTANIGHIGAVRGHTNFTDAVAAATSSYNIASIVKNGVGDYTITFAVAFTRADYTVSLSKTAPTDDPYIFVQTTTELRIKNVTNGTATAANLTGRVHVTCVGGDI